MSDKLTAFLDTCHKHPAVRVPLAEFCKAFRATLPPDEAERWSRTRLVAELSRAFPIGEHRGVAYIVGLALAGLPTWSVVDGQLVRK